MTNSAAADGFDPTTLSSEKFPFFSFVFSLSLFQYTSYGCSFLISYTSCGCSLSVDFFCVLLVLCVENDEDGRWEFQSRILCIRD